MRTINDIIIHCAATLANMDIGAAEIREWHVRERGWRDIGYHYVIRRNGVIEPGRDESIAGAHCQGRNARSIGICLAGGLGNDRRPENNFLPCQFDALERLIRELRQRYPGAGIHGHSDYADKACPVFDVQAFCRERGLA